MKKGIQLGLLVGLLFLGIFFSLTNVSFAALTLYDNRAAWEAAVGSFTDVDLDSQVADGDIVDYSGWGDVEMISLPSLNNLIFEENSLEGRQVPTSLPSWSGGYLPRALLSDSSYVYGAFSDEYDSEYVPISAFGFEVQPYVSQESIDDYASENTEYIYDEYGNLLETVEPDLSIFDDFNITFSVYDDFDDEENSLTQTVSGNGSAFFGWTGADIWDFDVYVEDKMINEWSWIYADGLAFARFVEGGVSQNPTTNTIPEPASMALMGLGLLGLARSIRRKR